MKRIVKNFIKFSGDVSKKLAINESSGTSELTKNLEKRRKKAEDELKKLYPDAKNCSVDITQTDSGTEDITLVCKDSKGEEIRSSFHGSVIGGEEKRGATGSASFGNLGDVISSGVRYLGAAKTKDYYSSDREEYYSKPGEDERSRILSHYGVSDDTGSTPDATPNAENSYRSGVDAKSAGALLANAKRNAPASSQKDIKVPDFTKLGSTGFEESPEYSKILDMLGLRKGNKKRILKSLKKIGLPELPDGYSNFIVAVRSPLEIKNEFGRDFTDIFICFTEESSRPDFYLGSTTPSPIFKIEKDKKYLISLGFIGLLNQGGPLIIDTTGKKPYTFAKEKDEVFGECFIEESSIVCQRYKIDDSDRLSTYNPGNKKSGNFGLFFRPANMDGSAEGIDATTYGDLVIKEKSAFTAILDSYSNEVNIFVLELGKITVDDEEDKEEVSENLKPDLKYISRFN
jgi:hypothetical protein